MYAKLTLANKVLPVPEAHKKKNEKHILNIIHVVVQENETYQVDHKT